MEKPTLAEQLQLCSEIEEKGLKWEVDWLETPSGWSEPMRGNNHPHLFLVDHLGRHDRKIRIKPEPNLIPLIPLGPEDVPPGSAVRWDSDASAGGWTTVEGVNSAGIYITFGTIPEHWPFSKLHHIKINRSLPLTGKWDANAWEPCSKSA